MATFLHSTQNLANHIRETLKTIKNEIKLLHFIIRNKRNYHRGRIRFRHLMEVSRKHKPLFNKWKNFSLSISNNISKNNIKSKIESVILYIDNIGKDTKLFIDIIMKCVSSFIREYLLSGHDLNFCYLTISILGRLYSIYASRLQQIAKLRKELFIQKYKINANNYQTIYWNDYNSFIWPNKVIKYEIDINDIVTIKEMNQIIYNIYYSTTKNNENEIIHQINNNKKNNKLIGQKRNHQNHQNDDHQIDKNTRFPPLKKQKIIHSTFELMANNNSNKIKTKNKNKNKNTRSHRKNKKQQQILIERDEIDDIFGDLI